jgi:hypothetical protein
MLNGGSIIDSLRSGSIIINPTITMVDIEVGG